MEDAILRDRQRARLALDVRPMAEQVPVEPRVQDQVEVDLVVDRQAVADLVHHQHLLGDALVAGVPGRSAGIAAYHRVDSECFTL